LLAQPVRHFADRSQSGQFPRRPLKPVAFRMLEYSGPATGWLRAQGRPNVNRAGADGQAMKADT